MSEATECARTLVGGFLAQGVTDFVLCPGSRSAPLALTLAETARAGGCRLHVRVDERSAGFVALGLAKGSQRPTVVVTTSGTAVGNVMPAVMEAYHAGVPLLVVSADRPSRLVGFGANQTTNQIGVFGGFVMHSARVDAASPQAALVAQATRAVVLSTGASGGRCGPVHLNVEFGEPLAEATPSRQAYPAEPVVSAGWVSAAAVEVPEPARTLIICGDATVNTGRTAMAVAEAADVPVLAEPSSNARYGPHALAAGRLLLSGALGAQIERVVVFGRPTLSRPVNALLSRSDIEVIVVADRADYVDPGWQTALVVPAIRLAPGDPQWLAAWRRADAALSARLADLCADVPGLTGPELAALVRAAVPADQALCLGNSNAIRDADLAAVPPESGPVYSNRGLSGIDGTVSTAIGVALAANAPTTLLCGDLSLIHDASALAIGPMEPRPTLRIVVADDNGGSIFSTLEYGDPEFAESFERVFATPTGTDLVAMVSGYGVPVRRLDNADEVAETLAEPITGLEVLVVTIDRSRRGELAQRMNQLAAQTV